MMLTMLHQRPIIVSVDGVNIFWQFYGGGVLTRCPAVPRLNHAVQLTGWVSGKGRSYYVAKNSWG